MVCGTKLQNSGLTTQRKTCAENYPDSFQLTTDRITRTLMHFVNHIYSSKAVAREKNNKMKIREYYCCTQAAHCNYRVVLNSFKSKWRQWIIAVVSLKQVGVRFSWLWGGNTWKQRGWVSGSLRALVECGTDTNRWRTNRKANLFQSWRQSFDTLTWYLKIE